MVGGSVVAAGGSVGRGGELAPLGVDRGRCSDNSVRICLVLHCGDLCHIEMGSHTFLWHSFFNGLCTEVRAKTLAELEIGLCGCIG